MKAKSYTVKKSIAPFIYTLLQICLLTVVNYHVKDLSDFSSIETIIFWLFLPIVFTTYILTFLKDPGFIPFDFISVTESSYRNEIMKAKDLNNSVNASQINKSKDSTHLELLKTDIESKDAVLQKNGKEPGKITPSKSEIKVIEIHELSFSAEKHDDSNNNDQKNENEAHIEIEKEISSAPKNEGNSDNLDELVCEPSFCENDGSLEKRNSVKAKEIDNNDSCFLKQIDEDSSKERQILPKEEVKLKETAKEKENLLSVKLRSNDLETTKNNTMASTTCATKIENNQNSKATKESAREKETKIDHKTINEEEVEKTQAINKVVASLTMGFKKLDEKLSTEDVEHYYIEKRYCTVCNIEQPIRSKHCKDCKRCVAMYDHHCPWMGTCIGEKNHLLFLFFLFLQLTQIVWTMKYIIIWSLKITTKEIIQLNTVMVLITVFAFVSVIGFFIMVFLLICAHIYLATKNLTTWENLSWKKISYLREWPKYKGSPFTLGFIDNLKKFVTMNTTSLITNWKIPRKNLSLSPPV